MPQHLTFYTPRFKKKILCLLISCKNKLFDGSLNSVWFCVVPFSSHKDFSALRPSLFRLFSSRSKVRLFVFWRMNDILTTSCSAVTIPYMLWLKCFRLSDLISYDSQQRGLKVRTSIITYSEFTYGFQNTRSLVLDSTWFLFCDSKSHMKYAISWCILSSNRPPTQPFLCHYA